MNCTSAHPAQDVRSPLRERLVKAALRLFVAQGYQAVSMRDLARCLGVQPGSLYYHVQSKEDLLVELLEGTLTELLHLTRRALRDKTPPGNRLPAFLRIYFDFKAEHEDELRLLAQEIPLLSAEARTGIQALRKAYQAELVQVLQCLPLGAGMPCDDLARLLLGALSGQFYWQVPDQELQRFLLQALYATPRPLISPP
ncbi:TetR/AcrR family transcriptional regulator [Pseudomonas oryzihabitans]|uniref:TetR/AcrR family transcriptional regulator n=1 Tax=Pseudomonas oryzihabitans TaxID=47885 RepID=UPI002893EB20|nr:TetR/AcrR family transcriptional regulator [Pseudomonas oryzihabitans]MDT3723087.1 TetR/AcrR family transcriptional regulator [Pseudomonas oryzihabitans]